VYLLPELWRTLFTRPTTVRYPFGPLELPPYFRGKVTIEPSLCTGCGACVRDCPAFALELERESRDEFRLIHYRDRCAYCGQCQAVYRQRTIRLTSEYVPAAANRDALCREFGKDDIVVYVPARPTANAAIKLPTQEVTGADHSRPACNAGTRASID
ncbi:MAG TPA: 4Fe-4S dicluster domain-containing protein, partial [Anaerolineae bacterium]|nr:4Fe-4S dicluster domain-containing protein [Anaerolineae bacterium]